MGADPQSVSQAGGQGCRRRRFAVDPRLLQILFLGIFLATGAWLRDFSIQREQIILTFLAGFAAQAALGSAPTLKLSSYRSAIITSLSLTLLLRADNLWAHPAAALLAIGSKFTIRSRGKHLFNPATFGVIAALQLLPGTWVSAGQWGSDVAAACWLVAFGSLVTRRVRRGDISWAFLVFYLGAVAGRVMWLSQRSAVWSHQLGNGALLLFAFFMISDPMTIPNHPKGRIAHAALVAAVAYAIQFGLYRTNGLLWALFIAAPAVPLWDAIWIAPKFEWNSDGGKHENEIAAIADSGCVASARSDARDAA
jgi:enediyne biosynthesis protein E5